MPLIEIDLTGNWDFKEYPAQARRMRDLDSSDWLQTAVPSSIFTSLIGAGRIDSRRLEAFPQEFAWVSQKPWVYRKVFDCPPQVIAADRADLVFDGLDTIATIWLNDKLLAKTSNMFIPYRFDVTRLLKPAKNTILVKFEPAEQYAARLADRYGHFDPSTILNPLRAYIRKAQYQFGWDWCPSGLAGCGLWQPVKLQAVNSARIDNVHIRTIDCSEHHADIKIAVKLDKITDSPLDCTLAITGHGASIRQNLTFAPAEDTLSTVVRIPNPALWWPRGYGRPDLYQLAVRLARGDATLDQTTIEFGIRTAKLNRSDDEHGQKFQFEINGRPIYTKGANWIPISLFAGSANDSSYDNLLAAAADANINILRVWGGGYYESDRFYRLADRLGIMVWQDFMFACSYYPDRRFFLADVQNEAASVITRLRNHPCLVLWCGNNEIDWLHHKGRFGKGTKFYGKTIYHKILPRLVSDLDDRDYVPTTPFGRDCKKPNDPDSGSVHQWDVWAGFAPTRLYNPPAHLVPRFVTEFGFQSLPNIETIAEFCPEEHLRLGSPLLEKHNYQLDGADRLNRYISELFVCPETIERFVYLSQLTAARAAKSCVEYLRAHNFRNAGALFWQFNDCFPAISWSAIDHRLRPKALYYYAKRFFSNVLVTIVPEFEKPKANQPPCISSLAAVVVNDSAEPLTAALSCRLIDLAGKTLDSVQFPFSAPPFGGCARFKLPKAIAHPDNPARCALLCRIQKNDTTICQNLYLYLPDKHIDWPKPSISARLTPIDPQNWRLALRSDTIVKDLQIICPPDTICSDNFLDLIPSAETELTIHPIRERGASNGVQCPRPTSLAALSVNTPEKFSVPIVNT